MMVLNLSTLYRLEKEKQDNMMTRSKSSRIKIPQMIKLGQKQARKQLIVILTILSFIQLFSGQLFSVVVCQDFEDLNQQQQPQQQHSNNKPLQHTFQPLSRQSQLLNTQQPASTISTTTTTTTRQRPLLSNRFLPSANSGLTLSSSSNNLAAQASSSAAVFSLPQQAGAPPTPTGPSGVSNIEQLMKNALARTAKLNSEANAEPRQDAAPVAASSVAGSSEERPAVSSSIVGLRTSAAAGQQVLKEQVRVERQQPESLLESLPTESKSRTGSGVSNTDADLASEDGAKSTTVPETTTTSGHETVYSDQRFANLFARRNNFKKSKIQPTEQIKAKPTLPSFIKSPPDPKQFSANQQSQQDASINVNNNINNNLRSATPSSSFASQRVNNQARINLANQQASQKSKSILTSNSAANASQKRANALASAPATPRPNGPKSSSSLNSASSNLKPVTNAKPAALPSSNNPFNRQQNNNDPANVIAMARKRLLANNALESAKLKQQQSKAT